MFNSTYQRFHSGSYLYIGAQAVDNVTLQLNRVANIVEGDLMVSNGIVHVIDRVLDSSAVIFEGDLPKLRQSFIAGSCSNEQLLYC